MRIRIDLKNLCGIISAQKHLTELIESVRNGESIDSIPNKMRLATINECFSNMGSALDEIKDIVEQGINEALPFLTEKVLPLIVETEKDKVSAEGKMETLTGLVEKLRQEVESMKTEKKE